MDIKEYLQDPCGTLSIPYWKEHTLIVPDSIRIVSMVAAVSFCDFQDIYIRCRPIGQRLFGI